MIVGLTTCFFLLASIARTSGLSRNYGTPRTFLRMSAAIGDTVPEGIKVDIITPTDGTVCATNEAQDFGSVLKASRKAIVFAVPVSVADNIFN